MNIFITYSSILFSTNLITVMLLRFSALSFFYNTVDRFWGSGFLTTISLTLGLLAVTCVIAWCIAQSFDKMITKIKKKIMNLQMKKK